MPQEICPRCHRIITYMAGTTDFVHTCDSNNSALNNEDIVDIRKSNWNVQGVVNGANPKAKIRGVKLKKYTKRGNPKATTYTRQHQEYINL